MSTSPCLQVENLSKEYSGVSVVDSLSFRLEAGEVLGLLGPNGAGKTTSVAMLYGAVKMSSGQALLMPSKQASTSSAAMRFIGVVTQNNTLDPDFDVRTNLELFGSYHGIPKGILNKRVEELLSQLELEEYAEYRIEQLSGGLERRVVLARALVSDPTFIFLDEPTTGFDPDVRQLFWRAILELRDRGKGILLTTHYMDEAQRLCDRLIILDKGKVLDQGSPEDLVGRWIGQQVVEVEGLALAQAQTLFPETAIVPIARGFLMALSTELSLLEKKLHAAGATQVLSRAATLEDVFLTLQVRSKEAGS